METRELYDGDITLHFDDARHIYSLDKEQEQIIPGVTTIVRTLAKPGLMPWAVGEAINHLKTSPEDYEGAKKRHSEIASEAAVNGTEAHKYAEDFAKGEKTKTPSNGDVAASCFAFRQFMDNEKPEILSTERFCYSKKHGYAGTLDLTLKLDGVLTLGDYKTSSRIYGSSFMETAARAKALEEEGHDKFESMAIIRISRDGKYQVKKTDKIDEYFEAFLACLTLHRTFNG